MGHGETGKASSRDALVETTIEHLARFGPVGTQPQEICAELGISKALVNYHFGGREGLIGEAITVAYERQSGHLAVLARSQHLGVSAIDTLEAMIESAVRWGSEHPGLAAAVAYPEVAVGRGTMSDEQIARLHAAGIENFASMQTAVAAARLELTGGRPFEEADELRITTSIIGWVTLGMRVWHGGTYLPTQGLHEEVGFDLARQHLYTLIRDCLSR